MSASEWLLWRVIDAEGDQAELRRPEPPAGDTLAELWAGGVELVWLSTDAARGLRDALNRLLGDDGGSAETGGRQATLEGAYALHAAQHRQLEVTARGIARQVDYQANALARLADSEPSLSLTVHTILDVHRRTVASLGDLLAALAGGP